MSICRHTCRDLHRFVSVNIGQTANSGNVPGDIDITGDPRSDPGISMRVSTPQKKYDLQLQRSDKTVIHEDIRYLTVSLDSNGKTVFEESDKMIDFRKKAKEMNFYHDMRTGTFVSVRIDNSTHEKPKAFVEGVIYDELMIAPPFATKRHQRTLYPSQHTLWDKNDSDKDIFTLDALTVPDYFTRNVERSNTTNVHRHKRQRQFPKMEPELLLLVDYALYQQFEGNANELLEYILHFWHAVNWKFWTIRMNREWPVIDLKIREIGVFKDRGSQSFLEQSRLERGGRLFSLYDAMDHLQKWLIRFENVLPSHDIAFLQTGDNACRKQNSANKFFGGNPWIRIPVDKKTDGECLAGTAGVAYVRGACLSAPHYPGNAFNFGIGEASTSFNGVIIAAHEVGHLLGAYHDGESEAKGCATKSGFIMSYTRDVAFKFSRFSPCSIQSFQSFLRMGRSSCLTRRASPEFLRFPSVSPGVYMNLEEQCRRFTGGPPCDEGQKQCEHLCCDDPSGDWRYTRSEPAVDGTVLRETKCEFVLTVSVYLQQYSTEDSWWRMTIAVTMVAK
ncbi:hypothetical protein ScPMuIL_006502, partial [Solemya velum]